MFEHLPENKRVQFQMEINYECGQTFNTIEFKMIEFDACFQIRSAS